MAGTLTPTPYQTVLDGDGVAVSGAKITTTDTGTGVAAATYTSADLSAANTNPIVADSAGRYVAYLPAGANFTFAITTSADAAIEEQTNIQAVPGTSVNLDVEGTVGEAVTAGQVLYLSSAAEATPLTAGRWYLAQADAAPTSTTPQSLGVAVSAIAINTAGTIRLAGLVTTAGAVLTGTTYYVDASTAGAITSSAPVLSRQVGVAMTTSSLLLAATTVVAASIPNPISQDLLFTDATYDIGKSGATRPRDGFFSRNAVIGGTLGVTGVTTLTTVTASQVDVTGEGDLRLQDNTGGEYVGLDAPSSVSSSYTLTFPAAIGSVNQVLSINNTDGTLQWATPETGDITSVVAGAGMTGGGSSGDVTLNVIGTADKVTVSADAVTIASTYVGQTSITTLGTIATGTWQGTAVADAYVANDLTISGGTVNNSVIGGSTPAAATVTTLNTTGAVVFNDAHAAVGFRVETDTLENMLSIESSSYSGVGTFGIGVNGAEASLNAWIGVIGPATTAGVGESFHRMRINSTAGGAVTIPSGTAGLVSALRVDEPNITATGTVTEASTLYVSGAPTEGSSGNYALFVDAGDTRLDGNLAVTGSVSKGSGSFKIDHPHPDLNETHHLVHSFVEGPRADLIYRGSATLVDGTAAVDLDAAAGMTAGTWVLLCRDEQVYTSNETGWKHVRGLVSGSTLTIDCEEVTCTDTVSWMVVAERKDQHMLDTDWTDDEGRVIVEPEKPVEPDPEEPDPEEDDDDDEPA